MLLKTVGEPAMIKEISFIQVIPNETHMLNLGRKLASVFKNAMDYDVFKTRVMFLHGQLGAGKTTITRGFLNYLGYKGHVRSPTYALVEEYRLSNGKVFHFDFYRLHDSIELEQMGIQDYFSPDAMCLIEWPEVGEKILPVPDLHCFIEMIEKGRRVELIANTPLGKKMLERLQNEE